jgi:hypothetical protein
MPYIGNPIYQSAFVTDTFSGNGTTTAFTMSVAPAGTTNVLVAVSGVLQDPSTYGVVGTTLNFSAAPPSGTGNISVRYLGVPATGVTTTAYRTVTEFTATAGQTTFTPPSYTVGFIDVYRNGVMLGSADYTATNGTTVVLTNPATAGDLVETISFLVSSVLNAIPNTAGSVGTANIADSAITTAKIAAGAVIQADLATNVAGTGPAFSVYPNANQAGLTSSSSVRIAFNTKDFDTNSRFNNTAATVGGIPAYAFLPNVAGYYQINLCTYITPDTASTDLCQPQIFKNGSSVAQGNFSNYASTLGFVTTASCLIYLNGSTDFLQFNVFGRTTSGTWTIAASAQNTYANGFLARAA